MSAGLMIKSTWDELIGEKQPNLITYVHTGTPHTWVSQRHTCTRGKTGAYDILS